MPAPPRHNNTWHRDLNRDISGRAADMETAREERSGQKTLEDSGQQVVFHEKGPIGICE